MEMEMEMYMDMDMDILSMEPHHVAIHPVVSPALETFSPNKKILIINTPSASRTSSRRDDKNYTENKNLT